MSSLRNEVIKISSYRETAKAFIAAALDKAVTQGDPSKVLIIDPTLINPLKYGGVTTDLFRKENNIVGIFELNDTVEMVTARNILYIVRPALENLRLLNEHITQYRARFPTATVFVYFTPKTLMAEHVLLTEYQLGDKIPTTSLVVGELDLDLFPLDDDLMSMELRSDFRDLYLTGDISLLHWVARSIVNMQVARVGPIPLIKAKGKHAAKVVRIIERLQNEIGIEQLSEKPAEVMALYVIDRGVDLMTPMMSQLTYEGLIDECYGIATGHFDPPFDVTSGEAETQSDRARMIPLNNGDTIFNEIRDRNFSTLGTVLKQRSLEVKENYERRHGVQHLKELKEFMKALPETQERHRLIGVHTNIATQLGKVTQKPSFRERVSIEQSIVRQEEDRRVTDYIEELINKGEELRRVLRLLVLYSVVNNGVKPKLYDSWKESLMLSYGIPQIVAALYNLEKAGLLMRQENKGNFAAMRKGFKLWFEGLNEKQPNDAAYAYSGYCPLLTRVVECMVDAAMASRSGVSDSYEQAPGDKAVLTKDIEVAGATKVMIIFVLGGITHAELSTMRFLEKQMTERTGEQIHFVFATTSVTNGNKIMESLLPFRL